MIRERDESLNTLLKLFQTEREFVLISFSDGVQRRYKNSKNVQSCIKKRLVRASQTKLVRSYNLTKKIKLVESYNSTKLKLVGSYNPTKSVRCVRVW